MNLVIDEAAEVFIKEAKPRRELGACRNRPFATYMLMIWIIGRVLLKGDNITLIQQIQ